MNTARKPLPGDAPVLVTPLNLGHRVGHDGHPVCGAQLSTRAATTTQAKAWSVMPCPDCWKGNQPW